jgi:predicted metal-dependent hydrolase
MPRKPTANPSPSSALLAGSTQMGLFDEAARGNAVAGGMPAAVFKHPNASREIRLQSHVVAYALRRAPRRSIGFAVTPEGLSVSAPRWVGQGEIEQALQVKAAWILRKLAEQRERGQRLLSARVVWADGVTLPYLGETLRVVLDPQVRGVCLDAPAATEAPAPLDDRPADEGTLDQRRPGGRSLVLRLGLPAQAQPEQIRDAVQSWLQRQARSVFEPRCQHYAQRLGVRYSRLSLSSAQTRWGSASANGTIRLNWRLMHFPMSAIDYVVAHELAHLIEMNHSPRFWAVVESVVPDYQALRGHLRSEDLPLWD